MSRPDHSIALHRQLIDFRFSSSPTQMTQELKLLQENSKVYKLIGPALVEQQLPDALKNVSERISFIDSKL